MEVISHLVLFMLVAVTLSGTEADEICGNEDEVYVCEYGCCGNGCCTGLSTVQVVAICFGVIAFFGFMAALVLYIIKRNNRKRLAVSHSNARTVNAGPQMIQHVQASHHSSTVQVPVGPPPYGVSSANPPPYSATPYASTSYNTKNPYAANAQEAFAS